MSSIDSGVQGHAFVNLCFVGDSPEVSGVAFCCFPVFCPLFLNSLLDQVNSGSFQRFMLEGRCIHAS